MHGMQHKNLHIDKKKSNIYHDVQGIIMMPILTAVKSSQFSVNLLRMSIPN